jgi:hypothetical protein
MAQVVKAIVLVLVGAVGGYYGAQYSGTAGTLNENQCALRRGMDYLWAEHVIWTRQFIVSSVAGLKDADVAAQRLLKNQDDIGNAVAPYYGEQAGKKLAELLREHITIAAKIVAAAIAKDDEQVKALDGDWHRNADDIATFLSSANPDNWTKEMLVSMLNDHLAVTTKELQARLQEDWAGDVTNYDEVFKQAQHMGQDLANGIIKQFPDKF